VRIKGRRALPAAFTREEWAAALLLVVASVILLAWRIDLVGAGPDPDSDSYGHHAIARQILVEPRDLSVHWVWLPLFHYAQAVLVLLGGTMETVRYLNVALWSLVPFVLFFFLRGSRGSAASSASDPTAFIAALFAMLMPIGMQMGTTAQPEPLFCLLVLGFVMAFDRARYVLSGALLAAAVLLRYEAWAILPVLGTWVLVDLVRGPKRDARERIARLRQTGALVILPALGLFAWAVARRVNDGAWLAFLGQTRDFASDALREKTSLDGGFAKLLEDVRFYAWEVPVKLMGFAVVLVPLGLVRTLRRQGVMFVLWFGACLAFVTFSWVMRSSLGLFRHFVVLIPLYATLAANGVVTLGELAVMAVRALTRERERDQEPDRSRAHSLIFGVVNAAFGALALWLVWGQLGAWMTHWRYAIEHPWPDRMAMGAYLRGLPSNATIVCDESTVEILSGLDRHRFDRHWVDEPGGVLRIEALADADPSRGVYVATWVRKLRDLRAANAGAIVFRTNASAGADDETGLAVLRVETRSARGPLPPPPLNR
jgi:hypothetical protein